MLKKFIEVAPSCIVAIVTINIVDYGRFNTDPTWYQFFAYLSMCFFFGSGLAVWFNYFNNKKE